MWLGQNLGHHHPREGKGISSAQRKGFATSLNMTDGCSLALEKDRDKWF